MVLLLFHLSLFLLLFYSECMEIPIDSIILLLRHVAIELMCNPSLFFYMSPNYRVNLFLDKWLHMFVHLRNRCGLLTWKTLAQSTSGSSTGLLKSMSLISSMKTLNINSTRRWLSYLWIHNWICSLLVIKGLGRESTFTLRSVVAIWPNFGICAITILCICRCLSHISRTGWLIAILHVVLLCLLVLFLSLVKDLHHMSISYFTLWKRSRVRQEWRWCTILSLRMLHIIKFLVIKFF